MIMSIQNWFDQSDQNQQILQAIQIYLPFESLNLSLLPNSEKKFAAHMNSLFIASTQAIHEENVERTKYSYLNVSSTTFLSLY